MSSNGIQRFEQLFLSHMDAAHNLARWLTKNESMAQDIVQESCLRAFKSLHQFTGGNPRAWLLTIVRNQSYSALKESSAERYYVDVNDEAAMNDNDKASLGHSDTPELWAMRLRNQQLVQKALEELPAIFREVIILKELEELSYKEIAAVTEMPIGTVMSRLARGREMLKQKIMADNG